MLTFIKIKCQNEKYENLTTTRINILKTKTTINKLSKKIMNRQMDTQKKNNNNK